MKIVGLDSVLFAVDDVGAATQYLIDYGLAPVDVSEAGGRFEALDWTSVEIARGDVAGLPAPPTPSCRLRRTVLGVADMDTIDAIAKELGGDREVHRNADGSIDSVDDAGFALRFRVTIRRPFQLASEISNAPGSPVSRPVNHLGVQVGAEIRPRSLSHIVYFVPDVAKAEAFYVERLGFRCTDRFEGGGAFLQPGGSLEHHSHFLIGAPPFMHGVEHFTFHFGGPSELITNGYRFVEKGYQAFWGPGRHVLGSNWFWYFNSPFGCHMEMDADMDTHDETWSPRTLTVSQDNSQAFLLKMRPKWLPGPGSPEAGDYA